jgi:hypothetical protein
LKHFPGHRHIHIPPSLTSLQKDRLLTGKRRRQYTVSSFKMQELTAPASSPKCLDAASDKAYCIHMLYSTSGIRF